MKEAKNIPRFADGRVDTEQLRARVNWQQLTEMERILLTVTEWDWERLKDEVKNDPSLATLEWNGGENLLCIAAHDNQPALTKLLLEYGANPNAKSSIGTALYCAVWSGNIEIVELLIENGSMVNDNCVQGWTPLHLAVQKGYTDIVELLVNRGADVNAIDASGNTPLDEAARMRFTQIAKFFLNHDASYRDQRTKKYLESLIDSV